MNDGDDMMCWRELYFEEVVEDCAEYTSIPVIQCEPGYIVDDERMKGAFLLTMMIAKAFGKHAITDLYRIENDGELSGFAFEFFDLDSGAVYTAIINSSRVVAYRCRIASERGYDND